MCVNKSWIYNKHINKWLLVKCGKCSACQQERALSRTNKIRANAHMDGSMVCLFVTLTYITKYIPYIRFSDFEIKKRYFNIASPSYKPKRDFRFVHHPDVRVFDGTGVRFDSDALFCYNVPVRRDFKPEFFKNRHSEGLVDVAGDVLSDVVVDEFDRPSILRFLEGQTSDKVGVIYYPDIQNFHKRLKQILSRNYGVSNYYEYFQCAEYGPTTCRPHFHLLIWCPASLWQTFKAAIVKAWPYADSDRTARNIEIARDASSYVSSYVNCSTSIPPLFKTHKSFKPKHSHSLHFGQNLEFMAFDKVCEAIVRGDLHANVARMRNGVLVSDTILLPKYVIHRYFPKFKGYYRIAPSTLSLIYSRPSSLVQYYYELGIDFSDLRSIIVRLTHCRDFALSQGLSYADYGFLAARCWYIYQQNILSDFYSDVEFNNYYAYDNISDLFDFKVFSPTLSDWYQEHPPRNVVLNPNAFPKSVASHYRLVDAFNSYSKDHKVRNSIMSQFDKTF